MNKATHVIAAQPRNEFGDNASRRLRKAGFIPANICARGQVSTAITLKAEEWQVVSAHASHMVTIELEGKSIPALVKEVQFNHLKNYVVHVDFLAVDLTADIKSTVALHPFGESYGATHGGLMEQELHELPVICRPSDLPEFIKVDVTELKVGDTLTVGQIVMPADVKADIDPETVVFHVIMPREEPEPEAAEAAQPEAINEKKVEARAADKDQKSK